MGRGFGRWETGTESQEIYEKGLIELTKGGEELRVISNGLKINFGEGVRVTSVAGESKGLLPAFCKIGTDGKNVSCGSLKVAPGADYLVTFRLGNGVSN